MAYVLLAISPDKNILDDVEYFTKKMQSDLSIIKETDLPKGLDTFDKEQPNVLFINTTFTEDQDGYQAVLNLRKMHHEFLPVIFYNPKAKYDFQIQAFRQSQCIDFLTGDFQKNQFIEAMNKSLAWSKKINDECFRIPQGKNHFPIHSHTFSYAEVRKKQSRIDVYEYNAFTGKKTETLLTGITGTQFFNYAKKNSSFVVECYRGIYVNKKKIIGYMDGLLILIGDIRVPISVGGKYFNDLMDYIKKI